MKCKICKNEKENKEFKVREMMFGSRDKFIYFQCANCGCLQIKDIPEDISQYYPLNYYSFNISHNKFENPIKLLAKRLRNHYAIFNKGVIGKLIYGYFPYDSLRSLSRIKLTKDPKILDVGCGSGNLLYALKKLGFKNLLGVDPYIEKDINYQNGLDILKKTVHEISGEYDLIMFHHSFEHISDPVETLCSVQKLSAPNGICLIRIPIIDSWAWENYGANWVQIDAPRHLFLHSRKSMDIIAQKAGFKIKEIICDSTEFQFWGSEQYKRDIPLNSENSYSVNPSKSIFSKREIRIFKEKAKKLNSESRGDQVAFYLKKFDKI